GDESDQIGFTKEQQWRIAFAHVPVVERTIRSSFEAYGTLRARPNGQALVTAPVAGRLVGQGTVELPQVGQELTQGQIVAALVPRLPDAGDLAALEQTVEEARLARKRANRHVERLEGLLTSGAVAEKRVIDARYEADQATARYNTARRRMVQARRVQSSEGSLPRGAVKVPSPLAGTVVSVDVVPGGFMEAGAKLCHVVDLDRLWLEVHVTETHAKYLEEPQGVWFAVPGFDDVYERGPEHVMAVGGVLDARTRTVPLYVAVDNPKRRLRVGMFADVHVLTDAPHTGLAVPNSAVVYESGLPVVYVSLGGETFARRSVRLGPRDGTFVELLDGVTVGERVVSVGAYAVRLASATTAVPEHGHHH
ncbi:MAG: efflux RND transporter periplasmic adaptor subunit, partial [Myxococcota bacterium]|nr:efflux RND transporter periplasmic adaptor subunit [Myxococcota bacterium]